VRDLCGKDLPKGKFWVYEWNSEGMVDGV